MKSVIQLTTASLLLAGMLCSQLPAQQKPAPTSNINERTDPLLRLLAAKGLVSADEAREIAGVDPAQQRIRLAQVLRRKGVLSEAEMQEVVGATPASAWNNPSPAWVAQPKSPFLPRLCRFRPRFPPRLRA